ncbi:methyl-accepting chemotaxis protein [Celerinatantimonas sp. YJH-8]|uniref:methyl-accepting chemotaxis protein n=1 Tax=Celerinatantimonas sp. YJH-8 TaxID=3228714 RepID=UPI0038CBA260
MGAIYRRFRLTTLISLQSGVIILVLLLGALVATYTLTNKIESYEKMTLVRQVTVIGHVATKMSGNFIALKYLINAARWGKDNSGYYVLVDGKSGRILIDPHDHKKEGKVIESIQLTSHETLQQAIAEVSQTNQPRLVEYMMLNPLTQKKEPKVSYLYPVNQDQPVLIGGSFLSTSNQLSKRLTIGIFSIIGACCLFLLISIFGISRHIRQRIKGLKFGIAQVTDGKFTQSTQLQGKDEFATLAQYLDQGRQKLNDLMQEQVLMGEHVTQASEQIDQRLNQATQKTNELLHQTDQLQQAMQQILEGVGEIQDNTRDTSEQAQQTFQESQSGQSQLKEGVEFMTRLHEQLGHSQEAIESVNNGVTTIQSIVSTIAQISEQTNLLALNAAIESARAGEHGRGFAVVADEVRQLASRTQQATEQIAQMIQELQTQADEAVSGSQQGIAIASDCLQVIDKTGERFSTILSGVNDLRERNGNIAEATTQQSQICQDMSSYVHSSNQHLDMLNENLQEIALNSKSLKEQTHQLDQTMSHFELC